jgi:hypothetical protein
MLYVNLEIQTKRKGTRRTDLGYIELFTPWYFLPSDDLEHAPDAFCRGIIVIGRVL